MFVGCVLMKIVKICIKPSLSDLFCFFYLSMSVNNIQLSKDVLLQLIVQNESNDAILGKAIYDLVKRHDMDIIQHTMDRLYQLSDVDNIHLLFSAFIIFLGMYLKDIEKKYNLFILVVLFIDVIMKLLTALLKFLKYTIIFLNYP